MKKWFKTVFSLKKKNDLALSIVALSILMLGFSYISVPLYQLFCQTYGIGGTIQKTDSNVELNNSFSNSLVKSSPAILAQPKAGLINEKKNLIENNQESQINSIHINPNLLSSDNFDLKPLTIHLNSNISYDLPWELKPTLSKLKVYPGDTALTFYVAKNLSQETITGVATYNVTPPKAGIYFNKIQCFCFEEQRLKGNEAVELPILFFIDSDFINDPKMKDIDSIILSYTFFKVS